ncbi:hypothetical protein QBC41DRAFT_324718 [Cercophora samala]|uniref:Fungal N-terminal domain-containing protein n=1 Tax=Cercophora samala TaxID=330535 RepID=A0AA39ZA16_9PEZI|nr:hypothetical protein QBC41DRAFT_324718 [Cercophora samala]
MGSPVSIGDIIAMSKISWKIAQAFTNGRKSAPFEFREVENQLYSLSSALAAFKDACGDDVASISVQSSKLPSRFEDQGQDEGLQSVAWLLDSCNETLRHLEKLVDKYSALAAGPEGDNPASRFRRWSDTLLRNYKKIAWTTEAGDIATLRSQLLVHTNSLHLVLGTIVNSRTSRIEGNLATNTEMLRDIHSWWAQNLKDATTSRSSSNNSEKNAGSITFQVSLAADNARELICPRTCYQEDVDQWTSQLLTCGCIGNTSHPKLKNIALSPITFPFRQGGKKRSWVLYKVLERSTNRLVSVNISDVAVEHIHEFQESFINRLAEATARSMLQQGMSNMLAHPAPDTSWTRALYMKSDTNNLSKLITDITFGIGHRSLVKDGISGVSLLHYRTFGQIQNGSSQGEEYAELLVYYSSKTEDITKSVLHLRHDTVMKLIEEDARIVLEEIDCFGFVDNNQVNKLIGAKVSFQMISFEAAKAFYQNVEDMRRELLIQCLSFPRRDETVALRLQVAQVQTEVVLIGNAELLITRDKVGKHRLIIVSENKCTILNQTLPHDCFTAAQKPPNFTAPTWLVQMKSDGHQQVFHYPKGFRFLNFHDTSTARMFQLGREALSRSEGMTNLPIRSRPEHGGDQMELDSGA